MTRVGATCTSMHGPCKFHARSMYMAVLFSRMESHGPCMIHAWSMHGIDQFFLKKKQNYTSLNLPKAYMTIEKPR